MIENRKLGLNYTHNIAKNYDALYAENSAAYGPGLAYFVNEIQKHIQSGDVLEVGAGPGRNSLFLAAQGFRVKAVDISTEAIGIIRENAKKLGLRLDAKAADANTLRLTKQYDVVICTFAIHNFHNDDALSLIKKMQKYTKPGGFNILDCFTRDSFFYFENSRRDDYFFPNKKQLRKLYAGWKVLKSIEKELKIRPTMPDGSPLFSTFAGIFAQKATDH
jgi:tellurite methyltransferase